MRLKTTLAGVVAITLVAATGVPAFADVKTKERTQVKFEGMLGRMFGLFGGKAAKEGVVSTVAVKGDRKLTSTGDTGEIIDLNEQKVYQLDFKKKTYTVMTFDELRRKMREAEEKAREDAKKAQAQQEKESKKETKSDEQPQMEMDFDLKETGQKRTIAGYDCREVLMTVTMRQKGKTLDQAGGMVLTSNMWLAPEIAALRSQRDFDMRYAKELYGGTMSIQDMQQMAAAMAMYPGMKDAIEKMRKENVNMSGSPLLTTMKFDTVVSQEQAAQQKQETASEDKPTGMGGLGGLLARKMAKKKEAPPPPTEGGQAAANRATIMTSTTEVLEISPSASEADVALPAGFRQEK